MVQYTHFSFYKADPQWRRLPRKEREAGKGEFHSAIEEYAPRVKTLAYSTVGLRADTDLVLWRLAESPEDLQEMSTRLLNTGLGRWLTTPHAYLSMARPSPYVAQHQHPGQEGTRDRVEPLGNRKYLFIYPFL
ncbi:MAG: chlorite dismutase family protein, partial [Euryarchaeota archaeon]|nr:chlorite dismutase family protein [Euryarchaeota archaeon]